MPHLIGIDLEPNAEDSILHATINESSHSLA